MAKSTNSSTKTAATTKSAKQPPRRQIRCYFCGNRFEVSPKTLSVPCPKCNKALKVEDIAVKSYLPVNDLQTCGKITIAKNGRVVAKVIRSGDGIECEGAVEGAIETDGDMVFGPKASWKGNVLQSKRLVISEGAKLIGVIRVPWERAEPASQKKEGTLSAAEESQLADVP